MSGLIEVPDDWRALSAKIDAEGGMVLLLGASDSGKTTLARWLVRTLTAAGRRVALRWRRLTSGTEPAAGRRP